MSEGSTGLILLQVHVFSAALGVQLGRLRAAGEMLLHVLGHLNLDVVIGSQGFLASRLNRNANKSKSYALGLHGSSGIAGCRYSTAWVQYHPAVCQDLFSNRDGRLAP